MSTSTSSNRMARRQRGMVLLMVVVCLVLLSIVGAAYLQVARQDRIAVTASARNNIGTIANATVAYIGEVLKNDLTQVDAQGRVTMLDGITDEPFDYPSTNNTVSYQIITMDGKILDASGGKLDDTWLASTEPDLTNNVWPHLTNLTGTYLLLPAGKSNFQSPFERPVDNTNPSDKWRYDTGVPYSGKSDVTYLDYSNSSFEDTGADADGDGIKDSKWTWAPIRQMSGVRYVMAVRIIDNSSMVNINTATSQVSSADTYTGSYENDSMFAKGVNSPRWLFPSELDLGNFFYLTNGIAPADIHAFWGHRFKDDLAIHNRLPWFAKGFYPYSTIHTRYDAWQHCGVAWNNTLTADYNIFAYGSNELELRHRNGLNNIDKDATFELEGLSNFVRREVDETTYADVPGVSTIADFFNKEPRHQMTTISGAATYMPPLPGFTPSERTMLKKLDVNSLFSNANNGAQIVKDEALGQLAQLVYDTIQVGSSNSLTRFKLPGNANLGNNQAYACQFAASFADHFDRDNISTQYQGRYGMEAWPFISEVYTQIPATMSINTQVTSGNDLFMGTAQVRPLPTHKTGYVIEVFNPHRRPISLRNIQLVFSYKSTAHNKVHDVGLSKGLTLDDIANTAVRMANRGDSWLWPGQRLMIYHQSQGGPPYGSLAKRDDVLTYVINLQQFTPWQVGTKYNAGDLVRIDEDGDGQDDIMECITMHTATTGNQPTATYNATYGEFMDHDSHEYWRRRIILVDGGAWPVDEQDLMDPFNNSGNTTVTLRPYMMNNGVVSPANWGYQSVQTNTGHSGMPYYDNVNVNEASFRYWQVGKTYALNERVYAKYSEMPLLYRVYRCIDPIDAGQVENEPINKTLKWGLDSSETIYYLQADTLGSVDGIKACAMSSQYACNIKQLDTKSGSGSYAQRFEPGYFRIGMETKFHPTTVFDPTRSYVAGDVVKMSPSDTSVHMFNRSYVKPASVGSLDSYFSDLGKNPDVPQIDSHNSQMLMDDQGVTYTDWTVNKLFEPGDIVRDRKPLNQGVQDGDHFYICYTTHNARGEVLINKPGISNGQWNKYWVESWRTTDELYVDSVAKLAHVLVAGPDPTHTVGDILGVHLRTNLEELMLPLSPPYSTLMQTTEPWKITHAAALLNRLSIHHPDSDTLDNDGDNLPDNPEEMLVPGLVNLNTVPVQLLKKILPVTDSYTRGQMVDTIVAYRDTLKGLSNPYQLSSVMRQFLEYSAPVDNATLGGIVIDFHNPDMLTNDGIANDREEAMLPTQWLTGVADVRSDIYTAYILIRGYPSGDFRKGPVESRRMIVVYDRSNIIDASSTPRILAVYTYE